MTMMASFRASLPQARWTIERFGLSPRKVRSRISDGEAPRVFCVSLPKAGTHLLERALCLHPRLYRKLWPTISDENIGRWHGLDGLLPRVRPGQIVASHLRYRAEYPALLASHRVRGVFLVRDPRDIVVSQVHYVTARQDHRAHELLASLPDLKSRIRVAIEGDAHHKVASIGERLERFAGWLDALLVVRFEDLIGQTGGGDARLQRNAVASIYRHLGMDVDPTLLDSICVNLYSPDSPTFRRGAIGGWRSAFDDELTALFDEVVGDRGLPYGYSRSEAP